MNLKKNKDSNPSHWSFVFNAIIENAGLREIPLNGRKYTWANNFPDPTFEKLDRFFFVLIGRKNILCQFCKPSLERSLIIHPCSWILVNIVEMNLYSDMRTLGRLEKGLRIWSIRPGMKIIEVIVWNNGS